MRLESAPMHRDHPSGVFFLLFSSLFSSLGALEVEPWLGELWEFQFAPSYTYSRYSHVQNGIPNHEPTANDQFLKAGLGVAFDPNWAVDVDVEFAETPYQAMGYRSSGYQVRHLWLDDNIGDLATFTTGFNLRGVSRHGLKDVSCPYHSDLNFEITGALGKSWDRGLQEHEWCVRAFGFFGVGIANHGSPWTRYIFSLDGTQYEQHRVGFALEGYFGFGHQESVWIHDFHGYGSIHHKSIDAKATYAYLFEVWGKLELTYTRRLYAHCFPEKVNFFTLRYILPFSIF